MKKRDREIEVRFLEINAAALQKKLRAFKATDLGKDFIREIIFYDRAGKWQYKEKKFVRLRQTKGGIFAAFKQNERDSAAGTREIEFRVGDFETVKRFLGEVGLVAFRMQEKKRHTFRLGTVTVDIDTWPSIPTYVELEGPTTKALKRTAKMLGLEWSKVVFESPRFLIEKYYRIPVSRLKFFTFNKRK